jgi:oligopeptide transport system substrate-binding protein
MRPFSSVFVVAGFLLVLGGCKNGNSEIGNDSGAPMKSDYQGGDKVVRIAENSAPLSIFPHKLTQSSEGLISGQIFEGLVKVDPKNLKVVPGLAESWDVEKDGKTIKFHLRKGVKFHRTAALDYKDVELTAKDVKFTFELLCTASNDNLHFATVCKDRIVGANECYENSKKGEKIDLKGLKIIDDYNFTMELLNSPAIFLDILGAPFAGIISKEAYAVDKVKTIVGAGPFILDAQRTTPQQYVMYKNIDYYGKDKKGNALPYLDSVIVDITGSAEKAWEGFKNGRYDFISSLPANQLKTIVEENIADFKGKDPKYILERNAEMITQYYLFNIHKKPFDDVKVRQAISYAIDRDKLIERVLFGQAFGPAVNGIVPPTFDFYKSSEVQGYNFDIEKAKKLLAEAGYPDGKGFPEVKLIVNAGNMRNNTVAGEIQKQLMMNLNVNVAFESLPNDSKFMLQINGGGDIFRDGWVADYPSPESFLSIFYGEPVENDTAHISYPNTQRYVNKEYDLYYEKGRDALDRDTASSYFLKAEKILMADAPLITLWYESNYRLLSNHLVNFYVNPLRHFDFSEVDVRDPKKEEKK